MIKNKKHNWKTEQPHHPKTGVFVPKKIAEKNPEKYTWVKEKQIKRK